MINTSQLLQQQKDFFKTGATLNVATRKKYLVKMRDYIKKNQVKISDALAADLGKSNFESYMTEIGTVLSGLNHTLKKINKWVRARRVKTPLVLFPSRSKIVQEPYGVVLIMSPWNYPFMLSLEPLFGAVAAGNCCVVKPSPYAAATSKLIADMIAEIFPPEYVSVVAGELNECEDILEQRFDYIFFTGSVPVGKIVMEKAARNLTPVTLELGGKSPCIVDKTADLKLAAKRIAFGKILNCGQTCVAPDYLLVDNAVKDKFLKFLAQTMVKMLGDNPLVNKDYGKIVSERHFNRLTALLDNADVFFGGRFDAAALKIEPTIINNAVVGQGAMIEEIFGPILPVMGFDSLSDAKNIIAQYEKPLSLYLFTNSAKVEREVLRTISFGGGCVNNTVVHLANQELNFGGVGHSGMGAYHGKDSFITFSHAKSVLKTANWLDLPMRYQPYKKLYLKMIKMVLN